VDSGSAWGEFAGYLPGIHPSMVACGSGQGRNDVETAGALKLREDSAEASLRAQDHENAGQGQLMLMMANHQP